MNANTTTNGITMLLFLGAVSLLMVVQPFSPNLSCRRQFAPVSTKEIHSATIFSPASKLASNTILAAKSNSGDGEKKKRRRKRKQDPESETTATTTTVATTTNEINEDGLEEEEEIDVSVMKDVASFSFGGAGSIGDIGDIDASSQAMNDSTAPPAAISSVEKQDGSLPLPDIKDTLKRKELGSTIKGRMEEEDDSKKKKIDRRDKVALLKVCIAPQYTMCVCECEYVLNLSIYSLLSFLCYNIHKYFLSNSLTSN
jgi:hypothetical protein